VGLRATKALGAPESPFQQQPRSMGAPRLCLDKALALFMAPEDESCRDKIS